MSHADDISNKKICVDALSLPRVDEEGRWQARKRDEFDNFANKIWPTAC